MPTYSNSPEIEAIVTELRDEFVAAQEAWEADPSEENFATRMEATQAFANARSGAVDRTAAPTIGGDTVQDGVN